MAGGLMQIVAYGQQDLFLTSNPDITFFKATHRKYTNFSIESMEQTFSGQVDFGKKVSVTVSRNADLINRTYVQVDLPALTQSTGDVAWTRHIGHTIIEEVTISIGGQQIDKHYGDWLHIWNELTQTEGKYAGYSAMIGNTTALTTPAASIAAATLYIPLQFWFCRNPGLALPIVALQFHEVKFEILFRRASECYITDDNLAPTSGTPTLGNASLFIDYIYLDTEERRQFAQSRHEYLIEQLQFSGAEGISSTTGKFKLVMNHPVKALYWVIQPDANTDNGANRWTDFTSSGADDTKAYVGENTLAKAKLQLNGQDRFAERKGDYFNLVQPYQHHTRTPAKGVYVYSFGLHPEEFQPSGTVNMSRIDTAVMNVTTIAAVASKARFYGLNVNLLKIMSGLAGVAYSN